MKSVLLVLLSFIFSQNIFSQTFSELKGFEDQNGNTHLFYRIYQEIKYPDQTVIDNKLYHWDLNNNVDTLFFDAYRVIPNDPLQPGYTLDIPAYDFWSLNPDKYIYSVLEMTMDPLGYIYRSDYQNPVYTDLWAPHHIYISHQDTSIVVADGGYVLRSIDGGFTWNQGAFFDFNAMSPFNDNILLAPELINWLSQPTGDYHIMRLIQVITGIKIIIHFILMKMHSIFMEYMTGLMKID